MSKMLMSYAWCRVGVHQLGGIVTVGNERIVGQLVKEISFQKRCYAKGKDCCAETPLTKGRRVEIWPKNFEEEHPPWKCECPTGPPPRSHDPYRIRVPEIAVPPLPTAAVKDSDGSGRGQLFGNPEIPGRVQDLFHNSAIVHPDYWKEKPERSNSEGNAVASSSRLGYHGHVKYQYAFHEPWKPLDRLALLAQAEEEEKDHLEPDKNIINSY